MSSESTVLELRGYLLDALPVEAAAHVEGLPPQQLYVPQHHVRALAPDVELVVGSRGVGKTVWFESLLNTEAIQYVKAVSPRAAGTLRGMRVHAGFGVALRPDSYPSGRVIEGLMKSGCTAEQIWLAVVMRQIDEVAGAGEVDWPALTMWTRDNPGTVDARLMAADAAAKASGTEHLVLFDALDRLSLDWETVRALVHGLFRVLLDLRGTRHVHGKAFVRPDMLERLNFPDASKLATNRADLTWPRASLFALLFHLLGNGRTTSTYTAEDFRAATGSEDWTSLQGAYRQPNALEGDELTQARVLHSLTGPYMGRDPRRGKPYTWLPNNLADERNVVSPRSFLTALRDAALVTQQRYAGHEYALHWQAIKTGVQTASQTRVQEIAEDLPWVAEAIKVLQGLLLPARREDLFDRWDEAALHRVLIAGDSPEEPRVGPDLRAGQQGLLDQLTSLGLFRRTSDGRYNMPEVYRVAFGLGRKGGVARTSL